MVAVEPWAAAAIGVVHAELARCVGVPQFELRRAGADGIVLDCLAHNSSVREGARLPKAHTRGLFCLHPGQLLSDGWHAAITWGIHRTLSGKGPLSHHEGRTGLGIETPGNQWY